MALAVTIVRADAPPFRAPKSALDAHGNEEASQAGLIARLPRALRRHRADKSAAVCAVTPLNTTGIRRAPQPGRSTGPNAGCLRARARDSGALRGEAAAPARDDGCLAVCAGVGRGM